MTTAAKRARQKARAKSRHEHVPGQRCQRCRPAPQEPGQAVWRESSQPLENLLIPQRAAHREAVSQRAAIMATALTMSAVAQAKAASLLGRRRVGSR